MFQERLHSVAGLRLNIAEGPNHGPPLWLFHGVARRWRDFTPLLSDLTLHFRVWANDHRGHGSSDRAANHYHVPDYIADANHLIPLTQAPAILVGHSLGALVALGVAAANPSAVRALVLLDPPGPTFLATVQNSSYSTMWEAMRRLAGSDRLIGNVARELAEVWLPGSQPHETVRLGDLRDAAALRFMARCLRDLDPETLTPPLVREWLGDFDPLSAAKSVRCPVLFVVADPTRGGMLPSTDADAFVNAFTDGSRVDLPNVGHLVHWQDPVTTLRLLNSFLGSL